MYAEIVCVEIKLFAVDLEAWANTTAIAADSETICSKRALSLHAMHALIAAQIFVAYKNF